MARHIIFIYKYYKHIQLKKKKQDIIFLILQLLCGGRRGGGRRGGQNSNRSLQTAAIGAGLGVAAGALLNGCG